MSRLIPGCITMSSTTKGVKSMADGITTVTSASVAEGSAIFLTSMSQTIVGRLTVTDIMPGVSFTIRSSVAQDTGNVSWLIL